MVGARPGAELDCQQQTCMTDDAEITATLPPMRPGEVLREGSSSGLGSQGATHPN
jgi:hypothetical protein